MKAILISDHAKWCALMMNGIKKAEVRKGTALYKAIKKLIEQYGYADIYVYCTKDKEKLCDDYPNVCSRYKSSKNYILNDFLNGKVIFKFRCYKMEEIKFHCLTKTNTYGLSRIETTFTTQTLSFRELKELSCLTCDDLMKYLNDTDGYAIHISDLEIFDRPRELCEFHTNIKKEPPEELLCPECGKPMEYYEYKYLTKAPQNFCYVEVE